MSSLADRIEAYIINMLERSGEGYVEMRRYEVADHFACVPSQVTYVLSTRFTSDRGFYVESRRGGGGYVRIVARHPAPVLQDAAELWTGVKSSLSEQEVDGLLVRLERLGLLTRRQIVMARQMAKEETASLEPAQRGALRAGMLKGMLVMLSANNGKDIR